MSSLGLLWKVCWFMLFVFYVFVMGMGLDFGVVGLVYYELYGYDGGVCVGGVVFKVVG